MIAVCLHFSYRGYKAIFHRRLALFGKGYNTIIYIDLPTTSSHILQKLGKKIE